MVGKKNQPITERYPCDTCALIAQTNKADAWCEFPADDIPVKDCWVPVGSLLIWNEEEL